MLRHVLAFALLPVLAAVVGALIAVVRRPSARTRSCIQHFAAGVVFSIVAGELLPDLRRIHDVVEIVAGFCLGVITMLGVRQLSHRLSGDAQGAGEPSAARAGSGVTIPLGLVTAVGIDIAVDGPLIGIRFAAEPRRADSSLLLLRSSSFRSGSPSSRSSWNRPYPGSVLSA